MREALYWVSLFAALATVSEAQEQAVPRAGEESGSVVSRVTGENIRFVNEQAFRTLALGQDLLGGDLVRTGAQGALGILFVDGTVMRLHPDTELLVKSVGTSARLELRRGTLWARSPRGRSDVVVETPAAAAGIRGTDWVLDVASGGVTRLTVYDGAVELANAQGKILTEAGQAAQAVPGQAPVRVGVANRREAPQMLYTVGTPEAVTLLTTVSNELSVNAAEAPAALAEYQRAVALLTAGQPGAAAALDRVAGRLGPERAATARWLAAFARHGVGGALTPPRATTADSDAVGAAVAAAILGNLDRAQFLLETVAGSPAARSAAVQLALLRDDGPRARAMAAQLRRQAAGSVSALDASAAVAASLDGDHATAQRLLKQAVVLAPDRADLYNRLGLAEMELDHPLEAEAALRRSLEIAPDHPTMLGNLAILLLDLDRIDEARALAQQILARDPSSFLGLRALGRAALQSNDPGAQQILLRSLAAQPAAAEGSIFLAIAAHMEGDPARAGQELDAAERLDPNDPISPLVRSIIALDENRADDAILAARRAAALYRAQEGGARVVAADRQTGSPLARAYGAIGLDGWARYTADRTYDPLSPTSLFGEGYLSRLNVGRAGPSADGHDGSLVNGLTLDPLSASYRLRFSDILRRPFLDFELGYTTGEDFALANFSAYGLVRAPAPIAFALDLSGQNTNVDISENTLRSGLFMAGTQLGARAGAFAIVSRDRDKTHLEQPILGRTGTADFNDTEDNFAVGGHIRLHERAFLVFFAGQVRETSDAFVRTFEVPANQSLTQYDFTVNQRTVSRRFHLGYRGEDGNGSWTAGLEGGRLTEQSDTRLVSTNLVTGAVQPLQVSEAFAGEAYRAFVGRLHRFGPDLSAEGLITLDRVEGDMRPGGRLGVAWSPAAGHWLRAAVVADGYPLDTSLVPASVVGLVPLRFPYQPDAEMKGVMLRYDWEVGSRVLLGIEHQTLDLERLSYETGPYTSSVLFDRSRVNVTSLRGDWWVGDGVGIFGVLTHAKSRIRGGYANGSPLPEMPQLTAELGMGFLKPSGFGGGLRAIWTSERFSGTPGFDLPSVATLNAGLTWESRDKRLAARFDVTNLFGKAVAQPFSQPDTGREWQVTLTARF